MSLSSFGLFLAVRSQLQQKLKSEIRPWTKTLVRNFVSSHFIRVGHLPYLHLHLHLRFVHPLAGCSPPSCLPLSSVCCFPNPGGSLLLCYVILPSSAWSSSRPLPSPWLPLCASLCPPIVLYSCYMTCPIPLLFQSVFCDIDDLCSFSDFRA